VAELEADYIQRMEDVLGVYEKPYHPAEPVVCLDEKPVPLHADVRAPIPAKPGTVVEPKAGRHFTTATPDRSAFQFAQVVYRLALQYPEAETVHLVMDNLNTHRRKSLTDLYGAEIGGEIWDRFTIHYTPKHGSWLDQAEIELSLFSRQCLGRRRISDLSTLQRETKAWNRQANRERTTINWRFTRRQARKTFHYPKPPRRRAP